MPSISCNGSEIYYEKSGNGEKNLVTLHGGFKDIKSWDVLRNFRDYTVYCFDLPYHGKTISDSHKRKKIDEELSIFVDKLGLDSFGLITDSISNRINLKYTANNLSRVAVSVMVNYRPILPSEKALRIFLAPYRNQFVQFFGVMQDFFPELTNNLFKKMASKIVDYPLSEMAFDLRAKQSQLIYMLDLISTFDPWLKNLGQTLIINGEDGQKINKRIKKLNRLSHLEVVILPGGHYVQEEDPEQFKEVLGNWLSRNWN